MADTFGKRQRAQRKKDRQRNKAERKAERAAGNAPELNDDDIAKAYFDDPDEKGKEEADEEGDDAS